MHCTIAPSPYLVATHPVIARMFLKWLFDAEERAGQEEAAISGYAFESKRIRLKLHETPDGDEETWVDTRKCLEWLTAGADALKILEDPLIAEHKELWRTMASADETVGGGIQSIFLWAL